jgi:uncharacterized protein (DUF697 family)
MHISSNVSKANIATRLVKLKFKPLKIPRVGASIVAATSATAITYALSDCTVPINFHLQAPKIQIHAT